MTDHDAIFPIDSGTLVGRVVTPERVEVLLAELRILESEMFTLDIVLSQRGLDPAVREEATNELAAREDAATLIRLELQLADVHA